jgi:predicted phage-related endonuclease
MPAILGLDPYRSPYDVYLDKMGRLEDIDEPSAPMIAGNFLEVGVLDWAEGELGALYRNQYRANAALHLGTHIDAMIIGADEPVEGKTAGLFGPLVAGWGDDRTDQVPDQVAVQAHVHMMCVGNGTEADRCHVPAFLGGRGFQLFRVQRSADLCDLIAERAVEFWEQSVLRDIPPDDSVPTLDVAKRIRRTAGKVIQIDPALLEVLKSATENRKRAERTEGDVKATVLAVLGDAEAGSGDAETGSVTNYSQTRRSIDTKRLQAELPACAAAYMRETTFRVMRTKKGVLTDGK